MCMCINKFHYAILLNFFSFTIVSKPLKLLIVRFSSIGDIVLTSPVLRILKNQKQAIIHYLTKDEYSCLLVNNPYVDKLHLINQSVNEVREKLIDE